MRGKITEDALKAMRTPAAGQRERLSDIELRGFVAVKHSDGAVSFHVEYGPPHRRRRFKVGSWGEFTAKEARERAAARLGDVRDGIDPLDEKKERSEMPTWAEWVETYLEDVSSRKKHPADDRCYLKGNEGGHRRERKPQESETYQRWKNKPLDTITTKHVEQMMRWTREHVSPTSANRWYASVRACFAAAWRAGLVEVNPCERVKKYPENPPRTRVLADDELERLYRAVEALELAEERALMRLLLETGCRLGEALRARWEDLDLERRVWVIPSPKAGTPQALPLAPTTAGVLEKLERRSEWVFPGWKKDTHRTSVRNLWNDLRAAAEIPDVNVHDLRRTYGLRVARQAGILAASRLLRHSDVRITSRVYVPLGVEDLRKHADEAAVVEFPKKKAAGDGAS